MQSTTAADSSAAAPLQKCDILEALCEGLEKYNGKFDFAQLESLSDEDLVPLVDELAKKLSLKAVYNVCQSMNDMTIEEEMKYLNILCTHLLLPKVINNVIPITLIASRLFFKLWSTDC